MADLNSGTKFRIGISAASSTVAADLEGATSNPSFIASNPSISFTVDETFASQSVKFDAPSYSVGEATPTVSVQVDRVAGPGGDVNGTLSVDYSTSDGTGTNPALAGTNYTTKSGTLTWGPGDTSPRTIVIPITDAQPQGGNKIFNVSLINSMTSPTLTGDGTVTAILGNPASVPVTIADNGEKFSFGAADPTNYDVNESAGQAWFSVIRSGIGTDAATVTYTTSDGTGIAGTNFGTAGSHTQLTGTVNFAAGQRVATFAVPLLAVAGQGGDKTFTITLSSGTDSAPGNEGITYGGAATENIIDTAALTNNLASSAGVLSNIETSGPFSSSFANLVGVTSTNFRFLSYQIIEYSKTTTPTIYPASGFQATSLSNLSLKLYNADNSGAHNGTMGNFNVYFIQDSDATSPTSGFKYMTADPAGMNGQGNAVQIGTFSFNDTLGYDTYTASSTIPPAVSTALLNALNTGTNFRLAFTPGTTTLVADFAGTAANEMPVLSITANVVKQTNVDQFDLSAASYTVNDDAGTATITVNRTYTPFDNPNSDAATLDYTTIDGSAVAGTNYTTTTNTLHFIAGQTSASFTIPILAPNPQNGNKTLTITLSNPVPGGSNTIGSIGQATASLTITDTHATGASINITSYSDHTQEVGLNGPLSDGFLDLFGSASTRGATFGIVDFNQQADADPDGTNNPAFLFNQPGTVTAINSITIGLVNEPFFSSSGLFDVYLVSDSGRDFNDPNLKYTTGPEGLDQDGQLGHKTLLGQINYLTNESGVAYTQFPLLNASQTALNTLIADINSNTNFRFAITSEASTTSAAWGSGSDSGGTTNFPSPPAPQAGFRGPQLTFNVNEVLPLPSWLVAGSNAAWDSGGETLTVGGAATIQSDPQAASPSDTPTIHVDRARLLSC